MQAFFTGTKKEHFFFFFFLKNGSFNSCYVFIPFHLKKRKLLPKAIICNKFISQCTLVLYFFFFSRVITPLKAPSSPRWVSTPRLRPRAQLGSLPLRSSWFSTPVPVLLEQAAVRLPRWVQELGGPGGTGWESSWCPAERLSPRGHFLPLVSGVIVPARLQALVGRPWPRRKGCTAGSPLRTHF